MTGVVVPLVLKPHGNPIAGKGPELLDQPIIEFSGPFPLQKGYNSRATLEEIGAISPTTVLGVGERDSRGIARIPRILGNAHFLHRASQIKTRQSRSSCGRSTCGR